MVILWQLMSSAATELPLGTISGGVTYSFGKGTNDVCKVGEGLISVLSKRSHISVESSI
jgi:hypothetical protein